MKVLDVHNNDRCDIAELLIEILDADVDVGIDVSSSASCVLCAHCFRQRRQKRSCAHCNADIAQIHDFEHLHNGITALVPSLMICSMLKSDGYLNVVDDTDCISKKMPFDCILKSLTSNMSFKEERSRLQSSLRFDKGRAFQLLEMSYFFSKQLLEAVFKNDIEVIFETSRKNLEKLDELMQQQPWFHDDEDRCSSVATNTHDPNILSLDPFSDGLKSSILPGYQDKNAPYFKFFLREVIIYRTCTFINPVHRECMDRYTASLVDIGPIINNKDYGSNVEDIENVLEIILKTTTWLQFIRSLVPEERATSSEDAYAYICALLLHPVEEAFDYFNAMCTEAQTIADDPNDKSLLANDLRHIISTSVV